MPSPECTPPTPDPGKRSEDDSEIIRARREWEKSATGPVEEGVVGLVFRRFILGFLALFAFAVLWALTYDEFSGVNKANKEVNRLGSECEEIVSRIQRYYQTNNTLPNGPEEIVKFEQTRRALPSAEVLQTNYIFHFTEAERAVRAGQTNIPIAFVKARWAGQKDGRWIGFIFPNHVRWLNEAKCREYLGEFQPPDHGVAP